MTATLEDRLADAISEGQEQVALQLLERHPDLEVNALGEQRNTLLHLACQRNHPGIVRRLLAHPAIDPNTPSRKTFTSPLVTAAYWGRLESVQVLLQDPRVDVNRAEFDGRTALWWASCFNYPGIIRWLMALRGRELDVGTSVTCGAAKYNPLDVAINRNAECAVKLLQDFAADLARLRRELRVAELQAAEYFAVVVLLADDLYLLPSPLLSPPESIHRVIRFLTMARTLPLELQMLLCNRAAGLSRDMIRTSETEPFFRLYAHIFLSHSSPRPQYCAKGDSDV